MMLWNPRQTIIYRLKKGLYRSIEKAMHACGHDAHLTMALGLAEYITTHKEGLHGTFKLYFTAC